MKKYLLPILLILLWGCGNKQLESENYTLSENNNKLQKQVEHLNSKIDSLYNVIIELKKTPNFYYEECLIAIDSAELNPSNKLFSEAIKKLEDFLNKYPSHENSSSVKNLINNVNDSWSTLADESYKKGINSFKNNNYLKAKEYFSEALIIKPGYKDSEEFIKKAIEAMPLPEDVMRNINKYCEEDNTKRGELNESGFNFCVDRQKDGYKEFKHLMDKNKEHSSGWLSELSQVCIKLYTKKGITDWGMAAYQLRYNIDSYENVVYARKNGMITDAAFKNCATKWWMNQAMWGLIEDCLDI